MKMASPAMRPPPSAKGPHTAGISSSPKMRRMCSRVRKRNCVPQATGTNPSIVSTTRLMGMGGTTRTPIVDTYMWINVSSTALLRREHKRVARRKDGHLELDDLAEDPALLLEFHRGAIVVARRT